MDNIPDITNLLNYIQQNIKIPIKLYFNPFSLDTINGQYKNINIIINYQKNDHLILLINKKNKKLYHQLTNTINKYLKTTPITTYNLNKEHEQQYVTEWNIQNINKRINDIISGHAYKNSNYIITNIKFNTPLPYQNNPYEIYPGINSTILSYKEGYLFYRIKSIRELLNKENINKKDFYNQLISYIYETRKYGVTINNIDEDGHIELSDSFNNWYNSWNNYYHSLTIKKRKRFDDLASSNKRIFLFPRKSNSYQLKKEI